MNTDVGLEAVGEPFEHHIHVDPVGVRPGVLQIPERKSVRTAEIKHPVKQVFMRMNLEQPQPPPSPRDTMFSWVHY